jgi:hypothetical protein
MWTRIRESCASVVPGSSVGYVTIAWTRLKRGGKMAKGDPARFNPKGNYIEVTERLYRSNSGRVVLYDDWRKVYERMKKLEEEVEHLQTALACRNLLEELEVSS